MNNNYIHFIGLLIIVGFSVISWIYRKLKEESHKKRIKDMMEERQREMLRTGRDPTTAEPSAESQREREIAARREAQLAELRRRALARQQAGEARNAQAGPAQGPPPIVSIPGSAGPTVPQQRATMIPSPRQPQRTAAPQRPVAIRPVKLPKQSSQPKRRPVVTAPPGESTTHRLVMDEVAAAPVRRMPIASAARPQTPEEWRSAIIANEILSPPLAVRTQEVPVPF